MGPDQSVHLGGKSPVEALDQLYLYARYFNKTKGQGDNVPFPLRSRNLNPNTFEPAIYSYEVFADLLAYGKTERLPLYWTEFHLIKSSIFRRCFRKHRGLYVERFFGTKMKVKFDFKNNTLDVQGYNSLYGTGVAQRILAL